MSGALKNEEQSNEVCSGKRKTGKEGEGGGGGR